MNARDFFKARNSVSELEEKRVVITTEELREKDFCTVIDFDIVPSFKNGNPTGDMYCKFIMSEYPDKFANGGKLMTETLQAYVNEMFDGDIDAARESIRKEPIKIKFGYKESKKGDGSGYTTIRVLDI